MADLYALAIQMDRVRFGSLSFLAAGERIRLTGDYEYDGKLIWKFDMNLKASKWNLFGRGDRNNVLATPVYYEGRVYIASGSEPEHGEGSGRLCCIDPTKTGDVSSELAVDKDGKPLAHRRLQAVNTSQGEKAIPNPNSGLVWEFGGKSEEEYDKQDFLDQMHRTISSVAIHQGLLIVPDISGAVHCLDAETGKKYWTADMFEEIWGSPLIVDDKAYVFSKDGVVAIFPLTRDAAKAVKKDGDFLEPLVQFDWNSEGCYSSPSFANGVLYICTQSNLYAIQNKKPATASRKKVSQQRSGYWPQWRGPNRDNKSTETGLLKEWPKEGPPLVWKVEGLGAGIGSVSVAGGRIFTTGQHEQKEYVIALDEKTGKHLWTSPAGAAIRQSPLMRWLSQRTPTVDGERLFAFTAGGELICLQSKDGKELWRKNYVSDFGGSKGIFGYCDFPLVDGDHLICVPGGTDASVVALNKITGEVIWKTSLPKNTAAYVASQVATLDGIRQYLIFLGSGLFGISPKNGDVLWKYERLAGRSNSLTPLVRGNEIFCASAYQNQAYALLKLTASGKGMQVEEKYIQRRRGTLNYFQDALVRIDNHIYSDSRSFGPTCINWETGEVVSKRTRRRGMSAILFADRRLYVRGSDGVVQLLEPKPEESVEKGRFSIPDHQRSIGAT
ncbi:MAG: PQQ-binding-like beta-propeller repeat protein, partial [Planctomycetes bacterium]|nr:PQQ-binding-like beta-propeller repeat protein [Planctomycetota bacterium]